MIARAFRAGAKVLLCGNENGSAADCQHMAAEFVSRLTKDFELTGAAGDRADHRQLLPNRLCERLRI